MNTFSELVTSPLLRTNLTRQGITEPTPVQAQSIPPAMLGQDLVATAQTGTGKTLAFSIPIIELLGKGPASSKPLALVLSPTRELALQIEEAFNRAAMGTGLKTAAIVGGMSESRQIQQLRKGAQVLIATPGRLQDFLDRNLVSLELVRIVVLDEADRMLDMGFQPAVEAILKKTAKERQTLFFSATFEGAAEKLVTRYMKNPVRISVGSTTRPADKIEMNVYEVDQDRKLGLLKMLLENEQGSFLVFARTKHGADKLAKKLSTGGFKSTAIHGDRSQNQRNQALKGFQEGYYRVLVATDVAARGIHVDGISHVVNYDLPQAAEDFIHRVGRTGRAGAEGVASTFATSHERNDIRNIERILKMKLNRKDVPQGLAREERSSAPVIVMPSREYGQRDASRGSSQGDGRAQGGGQGGAKQPYQSKSQSFRPGRRRFGN